MISDVIARSAIARGVARVVQHFESAVGTSRAWHGARTIAAAWHELDRSNQLRASGVAIITAAGVHVFLQWFAHRPVGWLWLVIPGIALAQGLLLVLVSAAPSTRQT